MINGAKRFLEIKENTNWTFAIINGISYIFLYIMINRAIYVKCLF